MSRAYASMVDALVPVSTANNFHNIIYTPTTVAVAVRPQIYDLLVSSGATPADNVCDWQLLRTTVAAPTGGTAVTPSACNSLDSAAAVLAMKGSTGGSTASVALMYFAVNQRVTWRWCAVPGGEIVIPSQINLGCGLGIVSSTGYPASDSVIFFTE